MKRKNEHLHRLFKKAHANRPEWTPTPAWRNSIMTEISRTSQTGITFEFDRLALRLTAAAIAATIVLGVFATWTMVDVSGEIYTALSNQAVLPTIMESMI
ncbi:hypothetical protein SYK_29700 [Pseudodesulfovibrio nedwellii]|uniref:Uncharacterized protein n=1 Tax=Pseudodesulfovibrio nedwellii TaxID=2973072 RepID=A0ABM8B4C2_9BACT|nr:hypothetical protein [Pseudodesulfovibrio nedwellii]BDQ38610.1 hypothetical protein SYK_29700 [Pseudodesulfovibrio nedwellii]